jgi:hypothetical protein
MIAKVALLASLAALVAGCAPRVDNTPAQERTWAAYAACRALYPTTRVQIDRVNPDGSWYWYARTSGARADQRDLQQMTICMQQPR